MKRNPQRSGAFNTQKDEGKNMDKAEKQRLSKARRLFPVTRKSLYLNHAAVSPYSRRVEKAMRDFISARTFSENVDLYPAILEAVEGVRNNIAALVGAHPDSIAMVKNTSEGLNILAESLPWKKGDRIILFQREFPANVYPFINLERLGVQIDFIPERNHRFFLEDVEKAITSRTRLLSVSHVEFLSGFRHNLSALGELLRDRGIIFCVDAIQSAGNTPIDVEAMKIDYISAGGQKWLMGPKGTGFIYVSPALLHRLEPVFAGWLGVCNAWDFFNYHIEWLPTARRFEGGTQNFLGCFGLRESTGLLLETGIKTIASQIECITGRLINGLLERGFEVITSSDARERAGIVTFCIPEAQSVFEKLEKKNVFIALRDGKLRVSPHFYNTLDDMEKFLMLLDESRQS
ncbi:MAG: aminotransferase class V-fold PLP-dependent enzyme [Candidatus Xenobiia bacterium LiM19]